MSPSPELTELLRQRANDRWFETERDLDEAMVEIERLQRRCEIYAAGLTAIADPLPGSTDGVLIRTAINTLRRVRELEND